MTTIAPETPMAALADRGEPLTQPNEPYMYLEINRDEREAVICFTEPLAFHAELAQREESSIRGQRPWADLTDEHGYLTPEQQGKIGTELAKLIKGQTGVDATVYSESGWDDEPSIGFEIVTTYQDGETFNSWFDRAGWPIVATIINVTDPGTFNCPYLFSAILYR